MNHAARPCAECPFRQDVAPGQFPTENYAALRETCRNEQTVQAPMGAPIFACHLSPDGREFACAGWLAVEGVNHIGVRVAVATGELPAAALSASPDWPDLHPDYETMVAVQGAKS